MKGATIKKPIFKSLQTIIADLRHVTIDETQVRNFCAQRPPGRITLPDWKLEFIYPWDNERAAEFFLLFNCINFAFWAKGGGVKWNIHYKGRRLDGAYGLLGALTRAIEEGVPLLEGKFLKYLDEAALRQILRGEGSLVLFPERVRILNEIGVGLVGGHGGSFGALIRAAGGSAGALAGLLVTTFPSFNDICRVDGREVLFYKRAQLAPSMIYQRFGGRGPGAFPDIDELTVFADYKLPQALRRLGVIRYDEELAARVDSRTLIPPCSREEIEIRACTIWACELIQREYAKRGGKMNAVTLDAFLWLLAHEPSPNDRPYHLTETIYY
ncbi:MAG: hypothetical protein NT045_05070 [Candidatus Aureabacteria bacterium]|nr:hypothetical protein [Candidatus Auribacterota bacterium]